MNLIPRTDYLNRMISLRGMPDIKIITGVRRSGKSKLLQLFMDQLRTERPCPNIIFVDFALLSSEPLKEYHALNQYIEEQHQEGAENIVCIDEVQLCPHFELVINSLHASGKYDIYLTGSNAFLLSADLATLFTGRYLEIHVFPFSFAEFLAYYGTDDIDLQFDAYVRQGGMPGSYPYQAEKNRTDYIRSVFKTIVMRDLTEKFRIADTVSLNQLAEFLMDNIGNLTSGTNISRVLTAGGEKTNHVTIGKYIKCLCDAFLFYAVKRYDIRGKRYLETSEKYYLCDIGFRYAVLGTRNMDFRRVYENLVCLELMRRGYEVYVGKLYEKEIDFAAVRGGEKIYIQVSDDIQNPDTFRREYEPLLKIRDAYPKMILARTRHDTYDYMGIQIHDLARWLAGQSNQIHRI